MVATSKEETHGQKFSPGGKTRDLENTDSLVPEEVISGAGKSNITTART